MGGLVRQLSSPAPYPSAQCALIASLNPRAVMATQGLVLVSECSIGGHGHGALSASKSCCQMPCPPLGLFLVHLVFKEQESFIRERCVHSKGHLAHPPFLQSARPLRVVKGMPDHQRVGMGAADRSQGWCHLHLFPAGDRTHLHRDEWDPGGPAESPEAV